jgi:hypothetical protein
MWLLNPYVLFANEMWAQVDKKCQVCLVADSEVVPRSEP